MAEKVRDTFTESGLDVDLDLHTPDTGTSWVELANTTTAGDAVVREATDLVEADVSENDVHIVYAARPAPTDAEVMIELEIVTAPTDTGTRTFSFIGRYADSNNYYLVRIVSLVHLDDSVKLFKVVSGTPTELASFDATEIEGLVQFIITDTKKSVRINGIEILSSSDNAITAAGDVGFAWGNIIGAGGHTSSAWQIDNFRSLDVPQEAVPDSDVVKGNWTDELGGTTNIYTSIDEATADDSDYVESGDSPSLDVLEVGLENPTDPSNTTGWFVHIRYYKDGGATIDLRVRLLQGATEIASWTYSGISTTVTYKREELTTVQAGNITDKTNLRFEYRANEV